MRTLYDVYITSNPRKKGGKKHVFIILIKHAHRLVDFVVVTRSTLIRHTSVTEHFFARPRGFRRRSPVSMAAGSGRVAAPWARAPCELARRHLIARARSNERMQQLSSDAS